MTRDVSLGREKSDDDTVRLAWDGELGIGLPQLSVLVAFSPSPKVLLPASLVRYGPRSSSIYGLLLCCKNIVLLFMYFCLN